MVRPRDLRTLVRPLTPSLRVPLAGTKPGAAPAKDPLEAMRWVEQVESRISRDGPGMVGGTVAVKLNVRLLEQAKPAIGGGDARP